MKLIKEIEKTAESNSESMESLYRNVKACILKMAVTNTMSRADVVYVCAALTRLYKGLTEKQNSTMDQ